MTMAMAVTSSSQASNYDVFLSFRGTDTRYGFTGNLYKALTDKGIHTFIDDEDLQSGEEITPALVKAIHESKIAIIVLSKNNASSSFCLDELATIIQCMSKGLLVIPVFYMVDPSHVRHHKGSYGDALAKHQKRFKHNMAKLQIWKEALHQVANLSGHHFKEGDEYEFKFIGRIVDRISEKINHPARLRVGDYLVGLESRLLEVMTLLNVGCDDGVHIVGIHGMGGVGKSTLAKAVYNNLIARNFDGFCYLENVREKSNKSGIEHLHNVLLQEILRDKNINITSVEQGASMIQLKLQRKKVLLLLDDVDNLKQLEAIVGRPKWFGLGSKVIITTRDQQLLESYKVKTRYEVHRLNKKDALQLLTWKAFRNEKADLSFVDVLNRVLDYASGLPLALEVIGSNLYGKSIEKWESAMDYCERNSDKEIQGILELSFIALQDDLKSVFLDIACCLKGYSLTEVNALYDHEMKYPIELLVQKSLVKVDHDTVKMHDLIQDMGKQIELRKSRKKRKRLWFWKDIIEVLKHNKGTSKIEIIYLDVPMSDREEIIEWDGNAFKEMENLKILIIKNAKFSQGPKCLPNSLRLLEWWGYPSNCLPSDFQPHKFVMCTLPNGCFISFELDRPSKIFQNLTVLKFDQCTSLTQIGDVSGLKNLVKLSFEQCYNLVTVHESVGHLVKVKEISAWRCWKLVSFPPIHLTSLEELHLSCTGLESFPEISGKMEKIRRLGMTGTPIKELPISFVNLVRLKHLYIDGCCESVFKLPSSILMMPELIGFYGSSWKGMKWVIEEENEETMGPIVSSHVNSLTLSLPRCNLNDDFFSIGFTRFAHVKCLNLSENNITFLPECIKELQYLSRIAVSDCEHLQEIRGVPPNIQYFDARNCRSLNSSSINMFLNEELYEAGMKICYLPRAWIPEWVDHHKNRGPSTSFWFRNKLPTNILHLVISTNHPFYRLETATRVYINGILVHQSPSFRNDETTEIDHTILSVVDLKSCLRTVALEKEWNHVMVTYAGPDLKVMGIHVFNWESSEEDIRFSNPCRKRKLDYYLNSFESDDNLLLKRCRFVDMEVSSEQLDEQQNCIVSCLLKWACAYFPTQCSHCIIM